MKKGQKSLMPHSAIREERWGRNFTAKAEEPENNGFPVPFAVILSLGRPFSGGVMQFPGL
jgi:hypothetical protein